MLTVVILAAGKGSRMKSEDTPKVLFKAAGLPMIDYSIDLSLGLNADRIIVVTGYFADHVEKHIKEKYKQKIIFARQQKQNGTADAVKSAIDYIDDNGKTLILCGDMPLMKKETFEKFIEKASMDISFISVKMDNPKGYGRVIRSTTGKILKIVEEKDANENEKRVKEVNTGVYLCKSSVLKQSLSSIDNNNAQNEYYLTDIVKNGSYAFIADNDKEFMGVNDRIQLALASKVIWQERAEHFLKEGVSIMDPASCYIDHDVEIKNGTVIYPNVYLEKGTTIDENSIIMAGCHIINSKIGKNVVIKDNTFIEQSIIGKDSLVGPMAHLRPDSTLLGDNKVGNFVELKKATMGKGSKASHLTYLGDASLGKDVNIGCGTITCNYDGFNKYETVIEDNVFIGSDTQLIAPVTVGKGSLIAAGSTITKDVPKDALALSRTAQKNLEERGKAIMAENKKKKEALNNKVKDKSSNLKKGE